MKTNKILLGLLAGTAGGLLLSILFAPDKGSATRKKIAQKGKDYTDALKDNVSSLGDVINEKMRSHAGEIERRAHQKRQGFEVKNT